MLSSSMLQKLLHVRPLFKLTPALAKQPNSSVSTQIFFNNKYNAMLLKESESSLHDVDYDYTATHHTIMELLDCGPGDAIHLIEADPNLLRLPAKNLIKLKKICEENNVPHKILRKNLTWICRMDPVELNHKFLYYWKWNFRHESERPEILQILSLKLSALTSLTCRSINEKDKIPQQNRISYYSEKLEASVSECTDFIIKYPFLMTRSLNVVFEVVDTLLDAGVNPKDIYKDPWPILYSPEHITERMEIFKEKGIDNIKPWMIRCKESSLARCIEIRLIDQRVLREFNTKEKYLCDRLHIDRLKFSEIKRKYPRVVQISLSKVQVMLDILLSAGFKPEDIVKHAEVLTFSPETIKCRIKELKSVSPEICTLSTLSRKNKRKFESYVKNKLTKK